MRREDTSRSVASEPPLGPGSRLASSALWLRPIDRPSHSLSHRERVWVRGPVRGTWLASARSVSGKDFANVFGTG
jgi:hypothetical protein